MSSLNPFDWLGWRESHEQRRPITRIRRQLGSSFTSGKVSAKLLNDDGKTMGVHKTMVASRNKGKAAKMGKADCVMARVLSNDMDEKRKITCKLYSAVKCEA